MLKKISPAQVKLNLSPAERVAFNLFNRISEADDAIILSDDEAYFLSMQNPGKQLWFYLRESCPTDRKKALMTALIDLCEISGPTSFVCSELNAESFGLLLEKRYGNRVSYGMRMNAYYCPSVVYPHPFSGQMIKADVQDLELLTNFMAGFMHDCWGLQQTPESQLHRCQSMLQLGNLYLWKDNHMIVSMANIAHIGAGYARINAVYTRPDQRAKGYGQALIANLSEYIIGLGAIPMLYADAINEASNKTYTNCGFIAAGVLQEVNLSS